MIDEYINSFINDAIKVLETMAFVKPRLNKLYLK
jgi:CheY-specific phosphatase CheX